LDYIADSLQTDLVKQGILVSLVKPGFVKTPLTDKNTFSMPFLMTAEEAAQRMFAAIQRRKRRFAFPKRMHYLLGLLSCLPKAWQHKLLAEIQV